MAAPSTASALLSSGTSEPGDAHQRGLAATRRPEQREESPGAMSRETSSTATVEPSAFETPRSGGSGRFRRQSVAPLPWRWQPGFQNPWLRQNQRAASSTSPSCDERTTVRASPVHGGNRCARRRHDGTAAARRRACRDGPDADATCAAVRNRRWRRSKIDISARRVAVAAHAMRQQGQHLVAGRADENRISRNTLAGMMQRSAFVSAVTLAGTRDAVDRRQFAEEPAGLMSARITSLPEAAAAGRVDFARRQK